MFLKKLPNARYHRDGSVHLDELHQLRIPVAEFQNKQGQLRLKRNAVKHTSAQLEPKVIMMPEFQDQHAALLPLLGGN